MMHERLSLPWKVLESKDEPEIESIQTAFKDLCRDTCFGDAVKGLSEISTGFPKTRDLLDIANGAVSQRCS